MNQKIMAMIAAWLPGPVEVARTSAIENAGQCELHMSTSRVRMLRAHRRCDPATSNPSAVPRMSCRRGREHADIQGVACPRHQLADHVTTEFVGAQQVAWVSPVAGAGQPRRVFNGSCGVHTYEMQCNYP